MNSNSLSSHRPLLAIDLFQHCHETLFLLSCSRGGPCNFPRSWLLPVLKDNIKDTELKYFFEVLLPLSADLRAKGMTASYICRKTPAALLLK